MSKTRLSALQKAVLYYFIDPDEGGRLEPGPYRYKDWTRLVLRWVAGLRGEIGGVVNLRRGRCTTQNLRRSFYRSLQNMEQKGLLIRIRPGWSGYTPAIRTTAIRLTPEGVRLARLVDPQDFMAPFEKLRQKNEREQAAFIQAFREVALEVIARERE